MNKFVHDVKNGTYAKEGWPQTVRKSFTIFNRFLKTYGVSKIGVTALTKIFARDEKYKNKKILINAVCPGYVATDMSSNKGTKTPDQGAETPVWLALLPADSTINGEFCRDKAVATW
jgi:carbonyl reductase 1